MSIRTMTVCLLAVGLLIAVGCSQTPPRVYPPSIDASSAGLKAIEMYDTDKDGKISGAELDKCPALKAAMAQIDTIGEKAITAAMITARIKAWQKSRLGRKGVMCTIFHNGRPLADAEVKFVPEKFLGENVKEASGKTNQDGMATISVPTSGREDQSGVAPGLYRVEITKAGEKIPAKYNTDTTLGQEVAMDAAGMREGVRFNLQY